jgi:phosphoesterase RecJ-like protein
MTSPRDHATFAELLERSRRVVLTTHVNPDGDAIGSQVALGRLLRERGTDVRIVNQDATPGNLLFIETDGPPRDVYDPSASDGVLSRADLIVLLDNSAPDRLGRMESIMRASGERVLCIDHHPTRDTPWAYDILDEDACATAAIVYDLILGTGAGVDARMAEALFVGLATDTGFFRFNSTTPRAFEIAAELMRLGVGPARCYQEVYERNSPAFTRLQGHALADLRLDAGGQVASIRVTLEMVERCGAADEDTSEMTTALLAMQGVRIAILFRELSANQVKVSLRSKGDLDVRLLAMEFGGGGHRNASGIVTTGTLDDVAARVLGRAGALARSGAARGSSDPR